jgi:hypothetical protein
MLVHANPTTMPTTRLTRRFSNAKNRRGWRIFSCPWSERYRLSLDVWIDWRGLIQAPWNVSFGALSFSYASIIIYVCSWRQVANNTERQCCVGSNHFFWIWEPRKRYMQGWFKACPPASLKVNQESNKHKNGITATKNKLLTAWNN